jgi:hypothetical protein
MVAKLFQGKAPCNILAHKGFRTAIHRAMAVANLVELMTTVAKYKNTMIIYHTFLGLKFFGKSPQY